MLAAATDSRSICVAQLCWFHGQFKTEPNEMPCRGALLSEPRVGMTNAPGYMLQGRGRLIHQGSRTMPNAMAQAETWLHASQ